MNTADVQTHDKGQTKKGSYVMMGLVACLFAVIVLKEVSLPKFALIFIALISGSVLFVRGIAKPEIITYLLGRARASIAVETDANRFRKNISSVMRGSDRKLKKLGWKPQHTVFQALDELLESWRKMTAAERLPSGSRRKGIRSLLSARSRTGKPVAAKYV